MWCTKTTSHTTTFHNTHTHMHAHARLLQLRSELLSLVSHCICNVIGQVLAVGPKLLDQATDLASPTSSWQAAPHQLPLIVTTIEPPYIQSTQMHTETNTMTHLVVRAEESKGSYVTGCLA